MRITANGTRTTPGTGSLAGGGTIHGNGTVSSAQTITGTGFLFGGGTPIQATGIVLKLRVRGTLTQSTNGTLDVIVRARVEAKV